jgi:hypothetical protein
MPVLNDKNFLARLTFFFSIMFVYDYSLDMCYFSWDLIMSFLRTTTIDINARMVLFCSIITLNNLESCNPTRSDPTRHPTRPADGRGFNIGGSGRVRVEILAGRVGCGLNTVGFGRVRVRFRNILNYYRIICYNIHSCPLFFSICWIQIHILLVLVIPTSQLQMILCLLLNDLRWYI